MTYLRTHDHSGSRRNRTLFFGALSFALIFFLLQTIWPNFLSGLFISIARPYWRTEFSIFNGSLNSKEALLAEKSRLERQIADNEVNLALTNSVQNENQELKSLMGRTSSSTRILAAVLSRPPESPYDELIIDIGKDYGLNASSTVYGPGNILIGQVVSAYKDSSKVLLFSSPNQRYSVMIGPSHFPSVAIGKGGGQYQCELPRTITVSKGDLVTSSAWGNNVFGTVTWVNADPTQPFQTVIFAAPINIYQLRWVTVDVNPKEYGKANK